MEDFKLERVLGSGGFGKTYLASVLNDELKKAWGDFVVLKVPLDKEKERILNNELIMNANILLKLKNIGYSPYIAKFFGFSKYKGISVMIMEYIDGKNLADIQKPLPIEDTLLIIEDILSGIMLLHKEGILHRDIKPSNIILTKEGRAKICDFGIAKFIGKDEKLLSKTGSYAYLPKERLKGEEGFFSDIYSVGIVAYELLTGRNPFLGSSTGETIKNILTKEPLPPIFLNRKIGKTLNDIILISIAKDFKNRFQSAEDFLSVIKSYRKEGIKNDTFLKEEEIKPPKPKMFVPIGGWNERKKLFPYRS